MKSFSVNGVTRPSPLGSEDSLNLMLGHIRETFSNESALVTSILVDGMELNESDERDLAELPLSSLESIEVFTSHPREVAEETLQMLRDFTSHLENYSRQAAESVLLDDPHKRMHDFARLVDGVSTFIESLENIKKILKISAAAPTDANALLEADLYSVLKELNDYFTTGEFGYVAELLRDHLPANLTEWREKGIPSIIRSRDS